MKLSKLVSMYEQGFTLDEIVDKSGEDRIEIISALAFADVEAADGRTRRAWNEGEAITMYMNGSSDADIAKSVGITRAGITKWRLSRGLVSQKERKRGKQ